ncbi:hypothetical protein KEM52_005005 [Ascosphaera acerosa]|nr:hypothetical protein KEM52_005005 [Ascosphaera acerosa]
MPHNQTHQKTAVSLGLKAILKKEPRPQQVEVLAKLIFQQQDVLLLAKTGFGKSIIFIAYGILTGKTSIIVAPLVKLGQEQVFAINRVPGASACLVSSETKYNSPKLLETIKQQAFTHVALGLEQAMAPEFRAVLRSPDFSQSGGLVAIDEIRLLLDWRSF